MTGLARAFATRTVQPLWDDLFIGFPEVRKAQALPVSRRHTPPQPPTGDFAAVSNGISDDLAGAAALSQPNPALVLAPKDKGPKFIEFQDIILLGGLKRLRQLRQGFGFFLTSPRV